MKKEVKNNSVFQLALHDTIPVMTGYLFLGFGFGILMQQNGYGFLTAAAMSIFIYAGSMQYVAVSLLTAGAGVVTTALTTLLVNARHLFYGISMLDTYKKAPKKPYLIFALTDETYSLVSKKQLPEGMNANRYYFFVSILDQCYWITGTIIGSLAGAVLPFHFEGIDFVLTALFLTIFVEQWLTSKNKIPALIGVLATFFCLCCFGADVFLIPAMALITGLLSFRYKKEKGV